MSQCVVILSSSNSSLGGAPEAFVQNMVSGLQDSGVKSHVFRFFGDTDKTPNLKSRAESYYCLKRRVQGAGLKTIEVLLQVLKLPRFVYQVKVIHKSNHLVLCGIDRFYFIAPLLLVSALFRIKIYRIITEIYSPSSLGKNLLGRVKEKSNQIQLMYLDKYLAGVIVLTNFLRDLLIEYGVTEDRILLIRSFTNLNTDGIEEITRKKPYEDFISPLIFCYFGSVSRDNGIHFLLDAFDSLAKHEPGLCSLRIIGPFSDDRKLRNKMATIGHPHWLEIHPNVLSDKLKLLCHDVFCFVNPRILGVHATSGWPTKIGEYIGMRRPIITTRVGDLEQVFSDRGEVLFADPEDVGSLVATIKWAINHRLELESIENRAYKWALDHLCRQKNGRRLALFLNLNCIH